MIGLAPSAAAIAVLGASVGMGADTLAKWIHESDPSIASGKPWQLQSGQLVIVDEAAMAATAYLDALVAQATAAGAKIVLAGDHCQLGAVDAGGAFALLGGEGHAVELEQLHRFSDDWEAHATRGLRIGDPAVLDAYADHGRLHDGAQEAMIERAFRAWAADSAAGRQSLLLAADRDTVTALNRRARGDRLRAGQVDPSREVALTDGTAAAVGEVITTRRNQRRIVREHVELGYALTVHRAQGVTADTSHLLVREGMNREALYVGLTRGRHANHAYIVTDTAGAETHLVPAAPTGRQILEAVLRSPASETSAISALRRRQAEHVLAASPTGLWPPRPATETTRARPDPAPQRPPPPGMTR